MSMTEENALEHFYMTITRASHDKQKGVYRWKMVASDTGEDAYEDNMSLELFNDFVSRINVNELAPEEFRSTYWQGGMPYVSISHYPDLEGKAVPGIVESVFIDGIQLKSNGLFSQTPLGLACYNAICKDLYGEPRPDNPIRVSIAFLDYGHTHKSTGYKFERKSIKDVCPECVLERINGKTSGKIFVKGQLVHLALTRVPANERTSMEVEKSMTTRKQDAESIVGEELVAEIDEKAQLVGKSQALVIKSDEEETVVEPVELIEEAKKPPMKEDEEDDEDEEKEGKEKPFGKKKEKSVLDERLDKIELMLSQAIAKPVEAVEERSSHELDTVFAKFRSSYDEVKASNLSANEKLTYLQDSFNVLAEEIKSNINIKEEPEVAPVVEGNDIVQALSQAISSAMTPIANKLDLLLTQQQEMVKSPQDNSVPTRRSITPTLSMQTDIQQQRMSPQKPKSETPKLRALIEQNMNRTLGLG
jgi:hypothetical protein